jgi:hypothetical protein
MSLFFFVLQNQRTGGQNRSYLGKLQPVCVCWGGGGMSGKSAGGWIWCEYCVHMHVNGKMISVETISGMEDKGEWWKGWIQVLYIWYIVKTTIYPQHNKNFVLKTR